MKGSFLILIGIVTLLLLAGSASAAYVVAGTELGSTCGDIYIVDLATGIASKLFEQNLQASNQSYPNANAFDQISSRFYFATSDRKLYFFSCDDNSRYLAGTLAGSASVASASFYNSTYYYICQGSDDLRTATFNPDGTIASQSTVISNFTGSGKNFSFGDIAIDTSGILYGSAGGPEFFKIDLSDNTYTTINTTTHLIQLAFTSDGTLYAHSAGTGNFYSVNPADGTPTLIGWDSRYTVIGSVTGKFTDLASIPEPATFLLLGLGGLVLLRKRRA